MASSQELWTPSVSVRLGVWASLVTLIVVVIMNAYHQTLNLSTNLRIIGMLVWWSSEE